MDWFSLLGGACLYVRLSPERLVVRDARAGRMFDQAAVLAVTRAAPRRIVAVGDQAVLAAAGAQQPVDLVRPFAHPRTLMADFTGGEELLKAALAHVRLGAIFRGLFPFVGIDLLRLLLLVAFPSITLGLVAMMK